MEIVTINDVELRYIELIRVALSEKDNTLRLQAINNFKHEVSAELIELRLLVKRSDSTMKPNNAEFDHLIAVSAPKRHEAIRGFSKSERRYEGANGRKLHIAEHIARLILLTIKVRKFEGIQTDHGILQQVRESAQINGISGAKDRDTLRKTWDNYRGVAHFGLAMDLCDENPDEGWSVLRLAESIRQMLSESCPKGTSKPYVDPGIQISFRYNPML